MIGRRRLSKKLVIEALEKTHGQVYLAAKQLGCSHTAIYNYINKYPDIAELKERLEEETTDIAALKHREAIIRGEAWAIQFQLKTKGKSRGYVERQEVTGADGGAIVVDWDSIDNNQD